MEKKDVEHTPTQNWSPKLFAKATNNSKVIPEINILRVSEEPLPQEEITKWLKELRRHSHIDYSGFAVSGVAETFHENKYIYTGGVNIENRDHNRLGIHGEQMAVLTLQTFLRSTLATNVWVMAARKDAPETDDNFALPCGHCRQILRGLLRQDARIRSVSLSGKVSKIHTTGTLLPEPFSELDLNINPDNKLPGDVNAQNQLIECYKTNFQLDSLENEVSEKIIFNALSVLLKPHIISPQFNTSPITTLMLQLTNSMYIPGILVQDIAFLTTDAVFTAMGQAISRFGSKNVQIAAIHLYGPSQVQEANPLFTGCELKFLREFATDETPVLYYAPTGLLHTKTLLQCSELERRANFATRQKAAEVPDMEMPLLGRGL